MFKQITFKKVDFFIKAFSIKIRTVDPKQMECFDELSITWWDPKGPTNGLRKMNAFRIPWIQNRLREINVIKQDINSSTPFKNIHFLDVGCGGRFLSEPLSQMGGNVTGIDPNAKMIETAKKHSNNFRLANLEYLCTTLDEHVLENKEKYDVVVASETIEHVKEPEIFVKLCVNCLKPGGSIFVTTNSKSWISNFVFITLLENVLQSLPRGTHTYDNFVDVKDLKEMLYKENCVTVSTCGIMCNIFTDTWFSIKNENLFNYGLHAIKVK